MPATLLAATSAPERVVVYEPDRGFRIALGLVLEREGFAPSFATQLADLRQLLQPDAAVAFVGPTRTAQEDAPEAVALLRRAGFAVVALTFDQTERPRSADVVVSLPSELRALSLLRARRA